MPVLAAFDGISIEMYYDDHPPPHFHAKHAGQEAILSIAEIRVLRGTLAPSVLRKVLIWAEEEQKALALEWLRARSSTACGGDMAAILENRIVRAIPEADRPGVRLTWRDGSTTAAEFGHLAGKGVFAAFLDPGFFSKVGLRDEGRVLAWPGELDFDADALWFQAHPEDNPFVVKAESVTGRAAT